MSDELDDLFIDLPDKEKSRAEWRKEDACREIIAGWDHKTRGIIGHFLKLRDQRMMAEGAAAAEANVAWLTGAHKERGQKVRELQEECDKWIERYRAALAERDAAVARNGAAEASLAAATAGAASRGGA